MERPRYWKLIGRITVPCTMAEWAIEIDKESRIVKQENVGLMFVSTVFLGLDHQYAYRRDPNALPILFETMIFEDGNDLYCDRYSSWEDAEKGHEKALVVAREWLTRSHDITTAKECD